MPPYKIKSPVHKQTFSNKIQHLDTQTNNIPNFTNHISFQVHNSQTTHDDSYSTYNKYSNIKTLYKKVNEIANREILNHLVQKIVKIENDNNILKKEISNLKRYLKEKNSIYRKEETENHKEFLETSIEEKNMFCWYHTKFKGNALKCQYSCSFKQKTYAQKPRIRTFYNSKIKK